MSDAPHPDEVSPPDVLGRLVRGEPIAGVVPTLEERVKAAIAAAPYHAPKFRRIYSTEAVLEEEKVAEVDVKKCNREPVDPDRQELIDEISAQAHATLKAYEEAEPQRPLRRPDPFRIHLAGPNVSPDDIGNRPHEFLARVARGEPIDGYLPPLKLRRIAAAASSPYYAATLRSVHFEEEKEEVKEFQWTEETSRLVDAVIDGIRSRAQHSP